MANTYVQNIMHITFHVKADCTINTDDLPRIYSYIGGIANNLGGALLAAGGTHNHIHLLLTVPKTLALSDYIMKIKSNSSRWMKTLSGQYRGFGWQDGYGAFSVSASKIPTVKGYLAGQAEHHRKVTYQEEVNLFWENYQSFVSPLSGAQIGNSSDKSVG